MARFHDSLDGKIPFTLEEEAEWDAREAQWTTEAPVRAKEEAERAIQTHLDMEAKNKGYDSILSACSYAGEPNRFQAEGKAAIRWRADVWDTAYTILAEVEAGTRTQPTVEELISELPTINWPA